MEEERQVIGHLLGIHGNEYEEARNERKAARRPSRPKKSRRPKGETRPEVLVTYRKKRK